MAMKIRLARGGSKKRPHYSIVAADSRMARDGRFIEKLGTYNPLLPKDSEERVKMNMERVQYWLGEGAQPTDRVARFLEAADVQPKKVRANMKKAEPGKKAVERAKEKTDKAAAAVAAAAEAAASTAAEAADTATDAAADAAGTATDVAAAAAGAVAGAAASAVEAVVDAAAGAVEAVTGNDDDKKTEE